ncbi:hypothetical protein CJ195_11415 [Bacillus sp. UMB0899]|nr:hypothetical protein CJ195_11415 [Bacillus sp. UMB0899]
MKYLIWPISLFIFEYINIQFPIYYGNRIQLYLYIFFILLALIQLRGEFPKSFINKRVVVFISIILVVQFIAMVLSYYRIDVSGFNKHPIKTYISFLGFVCSILVHYFVVRLNINDLNDVNKFLKGGWIALILSLIVCLIQLCYLFLPSLFEPLVRLIGDTVEARWGGQQANDNPSSFYMLGSYVQTTFRINGLTEEASNLATQFFVIFIPFILASIKNKFNIFNEQREKIFPLYIILVIILFLFVMAKTTAGFLFGAVILLFVMRDMNKIQRVLVILCAIVVCSFIFQYNFRSEYLSETINNFLLNKNETSVSNRSGTTLALLIITVKNFLTGIGWEYHSYYIFEYLPDWSRYNQEYYDFIERKEFPIMSVLLGWTAEFGIVIVGLIALYLINTQKKFRKLSNQAIELNHKEAQFIKVLCDSSQYYLIFTLISSAFLYVWYASIYLIVYFFFVSIIYVISNKLTNNASERFEGLHEKN